MGLFGGDKKKGGRKGKGKGKEAQPMPKSVRSIASRAVSPSQVVKAVRPRTAAAVAVLDAVSRAAVAVASPVAAPPVEEPAPIDQLPSENDSFDLSLRYCQ